jgi:hypothetical protein
VHVTFAVTFTSLCQEIAFDFSQEHTGCDKMSMQPRKKLQSLGNIATELQLHLAMRTSAEVDAEIRRRHFGAVAGASGWLSWLDHRAYRRDIRSSNSSTPSYSIGFRQPL